METTLLRARVTGPTPTRGGRNVARCPCPRRPPPPRSLRGAQVAFDVVDEGLERRNVEDADPGSSRLRLPSASIVVRKPPASAAPVGATSARAACGESRPALLLDGGRRLEARGEPGLGGRRARGGGRPWRESSGRHADLEFMLEKRRSSIPSTRDRCCGSDGAPARSPEDHVPGARLPPRAASLRRP